MPVFNHTRQLNCILQDAINKTDDIRIKLTLGLTTHFAYGYGTASINRTPSHTSPLKLATLHYVNAANYDKGKYVVKPDQII